MKLLNLDVFCSVSSCCCFALTASAKGSFLQCKTFFICHGYSSTQSILTEKI